MSSGDSDETGSEDESIKFDTIQRAGRRKTIVEKEETKEKKGVEEKVEGVKVCVPGKDGVVEKLVDEMVSNCMEEKPEEESSKENRKDFDEKENAGVVESVVEQLVSDTVDGSNPALLTSDQDAKESPGPSVELKLSRSDSTKSCKQKSDAPANQTDDGVVSGGHTVKEVEVEKPGETSESSTEPALLSNKKSEDVVEPEVALANHVETASESKPSDAPGVAVEKNDSASSVSKTPSNHNRSNSRGKKGKGDKNSPKKKKPNS